MSGRIVSYSVLSLLIFISSFLQAQQFGKSPLQIRVHMSGETKEFGKFGYAAVDTFQKVLKEKNLLSTDDNEYASDMIVDLREINEQLAAISIIILEPAPKEAVELAANAELLYSQLSEDKKASLPLNGKAIRQYASAEYMKQFKMLFNNYLEVINKDETEGFFRKIIKEYTGK